MPTEAHVLIPRLSPFTVLYSEALPISVRRMSAGPSSCPHPPQLSNPGSDVAIVYRAATSIYLIKVGI